MVPRKRRRNNQRRNSSPKRPRLENYGHHTEPRYPANQPNQHSPPKQHSRRNRQALQDQSEDSRKITKMKAALQRKDAVLRRKEQMITDLSSNHIQRCALLVADPHNPGRMVEKMAESQRAIKKRPFKTVAALIDQHNESSNLLMSNRPSVWMGSVGSSSQPENFFSQDETMAHSLRLMIESIPLRFRPTLIAATSVLTVHFVSSLGMLTPPPLSHLKIPPTSEALNIQQPNVGTTHSVDPSEEIEDDAMNGDQ